MCAQPREISLMRKYRKLHHPTRDPGILWIGSRKSLSLPSKPFHTKIVHADLWQALHKSYNSVEDRLINNRFLNEIPQANTIEWPPFLRQELQDAIAKCSLFSSPRPDHIFWWHLKSLISDNICLEKVLNIANTCFNLGYWPSHFKAANSVIIPKPNKEHYNTPKSFCSIVLLNTVGKLIEKAISNWLQFHMVANRFLDPNQLGDIKQRLTTDTGIYLTHLIRTRWLKQYHTSVIAFNITQFFPSLNHYFLSICLKKVELSTNIRDFFNSYHSSYSISYLWNSFLSPIFDTNVGVSQGSALSPILSTIYLSPIIKTFKKRIKNLKENIPTDILSFVDDSLLISQEKSYSLSSSFLLCSYNIMSKILFDAGLVMEHSKTELFYFTRAQHPPNPSINLTPVGGPVVTLLENFLWKCNMG